MGLAPGETVENYLTELLVRFVHQDSLQAIHDASGHPVNTIAEMLEEGDIRLKADSFDRERQVHRHIGDLLLFWSGVFPEILTMRPSPVGVDVCLDPIGQGRHSYYVASTFNHPPYEEESQIFRALSEGFEDYRYGLTLVRTEFIGRG
jgi:hypothetical protein